MAKISKKKLADEEPNIVWADDGQGGGKDLRKEKKKTSSVEVVPSDTLLRVRLEKKGRGGKTVTVIYELPQNEVYFKKLSKKIKNKCGTGGSFKGDSIEIQGDNKIKVVEILESEGFQVKVSGG